MAWLIGIILVLLVAILVLLILPSSEWKKLWERLGSLRWPASLGQSLRRRLGQVHWPVPGQALRRFLRRDRSLPPVAPGRNWVEPARSRQREESGWQERSREVMRRMREEPPEHEVRPGETAVHRQAQPALTRSVLAVVVLIILVALGISVWRLGTGAVAPGPPQRFTVLVANLQDGMREESSAELLAEVQREFAAAGLPPTMTLRAVSDRPADADSALALARAKRADLLLWGRVRSDVVPGYVLTLTVLPLHHVQLAPEFSEYNAVMMTPPHFSLNWDPNQGLAKEDAARALAWVTRFYVGQLEQLEDLPPAEARGAVLSPDLFLFHWMSLLWLRGDYEAVLQAYDELDCATEFPGAGTLPPRQEAERALCLAAANNRAATLITQESLGQLPASYLDEAATLLARVVQAAPDATLARFNLGRAYLARGKWSDAVVTLAKVVQQDLRNAAAWAALSEASTEAGDYPRAKDAVERAINLDRNLVTAYVAQGRYLLAIGQVQDAERALQQALSLAEAVTTRRRSLEAAQRVGPRADPRRAEFTSAWAQRNDAVLARVHLARARVFLRQAEIEGEPSFFVWLWRLIVGEMSPMEKANAEIELALETHPNWSAVLRIQAQLLLAQGKLDDAVVRLRKLRDQDPRDLGTYLDLIAILRRQWRDLRRAGRTQEAEQKLADLRAEYQLLIDRGVAPALGYFGLGDVAQENGELEAARQAFLKAVETDPAYAEAYLRLGQLDLLAGEEGPALEYFAQTLEVSGDKGAVAVTAHVERGDIFLEQYLRNKTPEWAGRMEQARSEFESARKLDGRSVRALNGLGRVAYEEGDLTQAEGFLQRALALSARDFDTNYTLGRVYEARGQSRSAAGYFRQALAARGASIAAHYHLGIAFYALLDEAQARQNLEWVKGACPNLAEQKLPAADDVESCAGVEEWLNRVTEGQE